MYVAVPGDSAAFFYFQEVDGIGFRVDQFCEKAGGYFLGFDIGKIAKVGFVHVVKLVRINRPALKN